MFVVRANILAEDKCCTGCAACANVCSYMAINMQPDQFGFEKPRIDEARCVKCGKCKGVCPVLKNEGESDVIRIYAVQSLDKYTRLHSTSGGMFSELSQEILSLGGIVAGARYDEKFGVEHCLIANECELEAIRRSKYQQSKIKFLYKDISAQIDAGKHVLFCGTPCQVAGLSSYMGSNNERVILVDFICRGVTSPILFQYYLGELQESYGSEVEYAWMKNKKIGWHELSTEIGFKNGKTYFSPGREDPYVCSLLYHNAGVMDACHVCRFKNHNSKADITLGDFWGLEGNEIDDNTGTSVVILRTEKGVELFERIKSRLKFEEKTLKDVTMGNPCLNLPLEKKTENEEIFSMVREYGFFKTIERLKRKSEIS